VIVRFVDIGGIVDHQFKLPLLNSPFHHRKKQGLSVTPIQQSEAHYKLKASRKTEHASIKSYMSAIPDDGKPDVKAQ
jgi:hypothetical protein